MCDDRREFRRRHRSRARPGLDACPAADDLIFVKPDKAPSTT
ncbi:hypothetical protein I553_4181 [Mycobacterium xenopi 4042]|uniref:Uncharacterized protein n=1 Tax=Mycobacterium xenopi 4042 TaxID=1299334 RepID=X8ADB0_MYCXE|nr:hypothetical protein I553_4181 [Mycobacterium xenopi 4042]